MEKFSSEEIASQYN